MGSVAIDPSHVPPDMIQRQSLCLSRPSPGMVVHGGDTGFSEDVLRLYTSAESNAAERLVQLKDALRRAPSDAFWRTLTEGLAHLADSQFCFVAKRILKDDEGVAVEMPPLGEPGACLMGTAIYINDGHEISNHMTNFKYYAYSCPCAYMKHDKIFIIPEKLNDFIVDNPNEMVVPAEAYIGIPLFADGKCFAHFGIMWSPEGAARRQLGWGYLEMLLHSLEDLVLDRLLQGQDLAASAPRLQQQAKILPHQAISITQSLKPYARSLSHELRTPMQGVVGMLDVMMANIKEAAENSQDNPQMRELLSTLKGNMEAVQDSSRRAVEAADNVVHAYDMNMGVPETPTTSLESNEFTKAEIPVTGNTSLLDQYRGIKRRREEVATWTRQVRVARSARQRVRPSISEESPRTKPTSITSAQNSPCLNTLERTCSHGATATDCDGHLSVSPIFASEHSVVPGLRHANIRDVLQYVINDALKVGGRPDSAVAEETELGEKIEVRSRSSSGQTHLKMIEWMVSPDVPETILIDEKDLAKMISCVTLNAIKFTDNGSITLKANLSAKKQYIVINIKDSGSGIPAAFLPNLFKPFSREDDSTTRQSEGLGLGLMVAKGLARKLGGDLFCVESCVEGPDQGSEFEIRIPLAPGDVCSRPSTPFGSPTPSTTCSRSHDQDVPPLNITAQPTTPPLSAEPPDQSGPHKPASFTSAPTLHHLGLPSPRSMSPGRPRARSKPRSSPDFDKNLATSHPLNILVVDDNRINRQVLRHMLKNLGYTNISEAYDGSDAIQKIRKNAEGPFEERINIVLMDLWMPLLDGYQATEAILNMEQLVQKPVILAVSADVTDTAIERAGEVGMKGFLTKPFVIRHVEKLIQQHYPSISAF